MAAYADALQDVAAKCGALFVPLFDVLLARISEGEDLHVGDGVHLNNLAYDEFESLLVKAGALPA